nr:MAG TPA: KilAC domain protein [Caudoviricetes sp.]
MNALIPIRHSGSKPAVNARDLHAFLEIGKDFSTWIKSRIEDFGFVENQDFAIFPETGENPGRPRIEYALSLDMAKELSMLERNGKGRQARQYFIECERQANSAPPVPQTLPEALRLAAELAERTQEQAARLAVAEPKAAALDLLADRRETMNFTLAAKCLKTKQADLKALLVSLGWIFKGGRLEATSRAIYSGYMIQTAGISQRNGRPYTQALITGKDLTKLAEHAATGESSNEDIPD